MKDSIHFEAGDAVNRGGTPDAGGGGGEGSAAPPGAGGGGGC